MRQAVSDLYFSSGGDGWQSALIALQRRPSVSPSWLAIQPTSIRRH
jgi:hypothetical protein